MKKKRKSLPFTKKYLTLIGSFPLLSVIIYCLKREKTIDDLKKSKA